MDKIKNIIFFKNQFSYLWCVISFTLYSRDSLQLNNYLFNRPLLRWQPLQKQHAWVPAQSLLRLLQPSILLP